MLKFAETNIREWNLKLILPTNELESNSATNFYGHENTHNPFLEKLTFDDFRKLTDQSLPV
jgi:hypothetical protein